ncbi:MAG: hypothetical protein GY944_05780 [bacterium]|nr:hypothetical protein [bacterium]
MKWIALLPIGTFGLMSTAVAVKLLLLARRTRGFPEFAISMNILLLAAVGLPLAITGRNATHFGTTKGAVLFAVGMFFVCVGLQMTNLFTWYVFRRSQPWARGVAVVSSVAFMVLWLSMVTWGLGSTEIKVAQAQVKPFAVTLIAMQMLSAIWAGAESFRYWGMQKRRLRLGLANPVVVERFLWWGLSHFASLFLALTLINSLLSGNLVLRDPFALVVLNIVGTVLVFTWGLSFFPPKFYVRRVEARAAAQ